MSDQLECSICFEPLQHAEVAELPCRCRVAYCTSCWDRSLAHSLNAVGQARCPTCRCPVRAEFDADRMRLFFSMEAAPHDGREEDVQLDHADASGDAQTQERGMSVGANARGVAAIQPVDEDRRTEEYRRGQRRRREDSGSPLATTDRAVRRRTARERLTLQARQAQVRILRQHGDANSVLQQAASKYAALRAPKTAQAQGNCLEDDSAAAAAVEATALAQVCAEFALHPPQCVCGASFERTSAEERIRRAIRRQFPHAQHPSTEVDQLVARMVAASIPVCSCDLCGRDVIPPEAVWTCARGEGTLLHTNAYDVCEHCLCSAGAADIDCPSTRPSDAMDGGAVSSDIMV